MINDSIRAGAWVNLKTNLSVSYDNEKEEDIVKSPVFIMTREGAGGHLRAELLDQNLNLLIYFADITPWSKYGTVAGHILTKCNTPFNASIQEISFENIKLTSCTQAILNAAQERRRIIIEKYPDMKSKFFNEGVVEEKVSEKIADDHFICPITFEPFKDPVTAPDGRNYEREAIVMWLRVHGTSPITREPMNEQQLITNYSLRASVSRESKS